jgi:hypothetical protein
MDAIQESGCPRKRSLACLLFQGFYLCIVTAQIAIELRKISLHTIQASINSTKSRVVEQHPGEDGNNDGSKAKDFVHYPSPFDCRNSHKTNKLQVSFVPALKMFVGTYYTPALIIFALCDRKMERSG